ncbi:hypothetical protein MHOCP_01100 [Moorella humiferrea]|uniref:SpoIIE family protein phosphatase n=1 Tax=Neomoorella humiferrea TaxID=676965 RepID=UPI0030D24978
MSERAGVQFYRKEIELTGAVRLGLDLLFLCTIFFQARGALLGEIFPFGPAAVVAVAGRRPRLLWPAVAIATTGAWFGNPGTIYTSAFLYLLLGVIFSIYPVLRKAGVLTQGTVAPAAVILVKGLSLTFSQPSFYGWVQIIFEALLAWGLSCAYLHAAVTSRHEERYLGVGLFLLGVLLGFQGLHLFDLSLQGTISRYIILLAALAGGPGAGAAAGAAVGFLPSLAQIVPPALAGLLAFAGLIAGSLKTMGKVGVVGGFLLAHLLLANYFLGQDNVLTALKEGVVVALALMMTPSILINNIERYFAPPAVVPVGSSGYGRREALKTALKGMARSLKFTGFAESPEVTVRQVAGATCRGCPAGKVCWELEGMQMLTLLQYLLQKGDHGTLTSADIPEWLASRCGRTRELLAALTHEAVKLKGLAAENALAGWLANTFDTLASLITTGVEEGEAEEQRLKLVVGTATIPRYQADVCGDTFMSAKLEAEKQLLVLADGMGAGREAAEMSATTVELVRDLLAAGFPPDKALQALNMILLLRATREAFTTCDVALINCCTGAAEFYKLGACPTFILRDGTVKTCGSPSLPAGILEEIRIEPVYEELQEGDLLVMVSDGVLEAHREINEKEKWLVKALQRAGEGRPQEIADRLLKQARALANGRPRDDMAIIVARIERIGV